MNNAAKYSWDTDRIIVNVSMESKFVCVSITDFGIGVEDHEKEKIFDRFYKGDNDNKANQPGFGIGLYISAQIVQRHGGRIWVEDNPAGGSVFKFKLPVADPN
jgi:signal transduction histidine kinase